MSLKVDNIISESKNTLLDLAELKKLCQKFNDINILNENQIVSIVLFGSYAHNLNAVPNDIDIAIVINDLSTTPRECFNIELLRNIAEEYKFNFKINGIPEFIKDKHITIDFCIDSLRFIKEHDPITLIDIASQPYYILFSKDQTDPYESIKGIDIPYEMKLSRILSSLEYIQENLKKLKMQNDVNLILKQLVHSLCHYTNSSNNSLNSAFEIAQINHPYLISFIEKLFIAQNFNKQTSFTEIENIFQEFKQIIIPKIEKKRDTKSQVCTL